jgi:hypothetical protein
MIVQYQIPAPSDPDCEIRAGIASWDDPKEGHWWKSVKFTWFNKLGHAARGGEVPVQALVDMLVFALEKGFVDKAELVKLDPYRP